MVFSNSSTKAGIVEEVDFLVNSNSTTYPIEQKTRNINRAYDDVVTLILGADGRWQWDDTNNTDLPIGVTNLASGQQDYSFAVDHLVVTRVEVKDSNGNWTALTPMDQNDLNTASFNSLSSNKPGGVFTDRQSLTAFLNTPGIPLYYDKLASSIFLYPAPNYNSTGALKVYFQRGPNYFATNDTTKQPGFATHLHRYLSVSAAYDFALAKGLTNKLTSLKNEMIEWGSKITEFYTYRPKDESVIIRPHIENYN